jgi:hypothetical protein
VRPSAGHVRLLAATIALAIASPSNLPTWPVDRDPSSEPFAAFGAKVEQGPTVLKAARLPVWHPAWCVVSADPSDEPDIGCEGWFPAPTPGMITPRDRSLPVASRPGLLGDAPARTPCLAGVACRLRC